VPLSSPAMAADARTFLDTFFIKMASSNRRTYGTFDLEREGISVLECKYNTP
jgi:hypothetical protein